MIGTLLDTAKTAIGKQHVTLETELSGEGEMVLVRPDVANAWISLPDRLDGEVLIYRKRDRHVMAEIHKARKDGLRLALPPGDYAATVRREKKGYHCEIELKRSRSATLELDACEEIPLEKLSTKGEGHRREEHLFFELGMGILFKKESDYESRLTEFGYQDDFFTDKRFHYAVSAFYSPLRYLQIGVGFSSLDRGRWRDQSGIHLGVSRTLGSDLDSTIGKEFEWKATGPASTCAVVCPSSMTGSSFIWKPRGGWHGPRPSTGTTGTRTPW